MSYQDGGYREGEEVWLHPVKYKPWIRHRCRITKVKRYPPQGQTVLYDTDYTWMAEGRTEPSKAVGLNAHWLAPISAVDRLAALTPGRTTV